MAVQTSRFLPASEAESSAAMPLNAWWRNTSPIAAEKCKSLQRKNVSPHTLRHSAAMDLLQNGVDRTVIALWLGHESVETTQIYLHADMKLKEQALSRTPPLGVKPGRYRPDDQLLAFLESL